jgi:hypothetical protein
MAHEPDPTTPNDINGGRYVSLPEQRFARRQPALSRSRGIDHTQPEFRIQRIVSRERRSWTGI